MDLGIEGRVALVTAASKGLGRGAAEALAAEGAKVVICARGEEALRATERSIADAGGEVLAIQADVTEPAAPGRLVAATVERFGALHILVPNAGGPPSSRALEVTEASMAAGLNANFTTSVRLVQEAVPHMRGAGWGRICAITSSTVKQPSPTLAMSNAARTALWAWAKTAAADLLPNGITCNLICPGLHDTDRIRGLFGGTPPPGAVGDPGDFGRIVAFLCSETARFVTGTALAVDGGAVQGLL